MFYKSLWSLPLCDISVLLSLCVCLFCTCVRWRRGTSWSCGCSSWWTFDRESCLHHQLHTHAPQHTVGVCGHVTVCYQLIAISEVPDVVDSSGGFEVSTGVMELDVEDHVLTAEKNILRLANRSLLGDVDCQWDLI